MAKRRPRKRSILLFAAKFLCFVAVLVVLWWTVLPYYGFVLAQSTGATLRWVMQMPIEYARVEPHGFLNTESHLVFGLNEGSVMHTRSMPIAVLVTNVPPYWALVLATAGLALRRRVKVLFLGTGILVAGHFLFIVVASRFGPLMQGSEVITAVAQFNLTLPFLLWIVFAYRFRLAAYLGETAAKTPPQKDPA
ncbi:MAG: hypothetical protein HC888_07990 [Candidatus Competibacteraceae bacterium]|nr:hypothetical protein [Candidatus Competibacteraceae bacterium]